MLLNESADWSRGEINVRSDVLDFFWTPDIIIHDLVSFNKPEVMSEVAALEIVRDHSLYYKVRSSVTIVCRGMVFSRYPIDSHTCALRLSSYGYDTSQMRLSGKFTFDRTSQRVLNFHTEIRELELGQRVWIGANRNYSVYGLEILLQRSLTPFLFTVYLPSSLLVVATWGSFLVPPDMVPARLILLVSATLLLVQLTSNARSSIPPTDSITAIEVWLLSCLAFGIVAITQYCLLLRASGQRKMRPLPAPGSPLQRNRMCSSPPSSLHTRVVSSCGRRMEVIQMVRSKSSG